MLLKHGLKYYYTAELCPFVSAVHLSLYTGDRLISLAQWVFLSFKKSICGLLFPVKTDFFHFFIFFAFCTVLWPTRKCQRMQTQAVSRTLAQWNAHCAFTIISIVWQTPMWLLFHVKLALFRAEMSSHQSICTLTHAPDSDGTYRRKDSPDCDISWHTCRLPLRPGWCWTHSCISAEKKSFRNSL